MEISAQQFASSVKDPKVFVTTHTSLFSTRGSRSEKEGDIYIILKLSSENSLPFARLSRFILDSVVDGYIYSHAKTTNESLKGALSDGVNKINTIMKQDKELSETPIQADIIMVLVKKEGVYVGLTGEGEVLVSKGEKVVDIAEIMRNKSANTAGVVLEENEALLLSTVGILSKNLAEITLASEEKRIQRETTRIGVSLPENSAIMCFSNSKEEILAESVPVEEKPKIVNTFIPKTEEEIEGKKVDNTAKETIAKISDMKGKIKVPPKVKETIAKIPNIKGKIKVSPKVKETFVKTWEFIKKAGGKTWEFIKKVGGKIWVAIKTAGRKIWEKISSALATKRWFKRVMSKASVVKLGSNPRVVRAGGVRVDAYKVRDLRGRRFKLFFGVILIVILVIVGVNFTLKTKEANAISKDANEKIAKIEELLNKTEGNFVADKESAETTYFEASQIIAKIPEGLREKDREKVNAVKERYTKVGDELFKKKGFSEELGNLSQFLSGKIHFGEDSDPTDIEIFKDDSDNEYIAVVDRGKKSLFVVSLADISTLKAVEDSDRLMKTPLYVSSGVGGLYIYDKDAGMVKSPLKDGVFGNIIALNGLGAKDIPPKDVSEMVILTENDNIYLLGRDSKAVLKSTAIYPDRYGMFMHYIDNDQIATATDIMGDFSVYIINSGSESGVLRYSYNYVTEKQQEVPLSIAGLSGSIGKVEKAYNDTSSLNTGFYMFDIEGRRFLKFEKPIEAGEEARHPNQLLFQEQYEYRGGEEADFKDVKDFVVDEDEKNIYVLDGSTIWKVSL